MKKLLYILFILFSHLNSSGQINLCQGDSIENFAVPLTVGSNYSWSVVGSSTIASIISGNGSERVSLAINDTGSFWLYVTETDLNLCIGKDSLLIKIHPKPNPNIFSLEPTTFCDGDSILIELDSNYSYMLWNNGSTLGNTYADTTASYSVTVIDDNGCSNISNVILVNSVTSPIASFVVDGLCLGLPTNFINQSIIPLGQNFSSKWNLGNGDFDFGDTISYTYNQLGSYEVSLSIETDIGCNDSTTQTILILENPKANFSYSPFKISTLNPEVNFINTSIDAIPILWDFGDSIFSIQIDPFHSFENPGIYNVMLVVEDINQCIDTIVKQIIMTYDFLLHVPNAFTPNNDGDNDNFGPNGFRMDRFKDYEFSIFNRWGGLIFITNDVNEQWDGVDFPAEMYNWFISLVDELGNTRKLFGSVTLIR